MLGIGNAMWRIVANSRLNGALNVCACGENNGQESIGAKHAVIGISRWLKRVSDFDLPVRPPDTLSAASRGQRRAAFRSLHASAMKPAPFKYIAATSLEHALSLKAEHGDEAKFLAGGQSLMPTMNFRLARPAVLIDINRHRRPCRYRSAGRARASRIGALTRYRDAGTGQQLPGILSVDSPKRCRISPIRKSATAAPSAETCRMPTRPPSFRPWRWRCRRACSSNVQTGEREVAASGFFRGRADDGSRSRMKCWWRSSCRGRSRAPDAASWRSRAGAAILPSSAWRRS